MNRIEAARRNGALSNGPATAEGKAISSKNALKFGLTANDVLITGESAAEYDALCRPLVTNSALKMPGNSTSSGKSLPTVGGCGVSFKWSRPSS